MRAKGHGENLRVGDLSKTVELGKIVEELDDSENALWSGLEEVVESLRASNNTIPRKNVSVLVEDVQELLRDHLDSLLDRLAG